jgi:hypothetical protein
MEDLWEITLKGNKDQEMSHTNGNGDYKEGGVKDDLE